MARLNIVIYPDPALRRKSKHIDEINEEMKTLASDMLETMYDGTGIGLAAPQVGVNLRLVVMDVDQTEQDKSKDQEKIRNPLTFFNPEIVEEAGEIEWSEGCLSLPGLSVTMRRSETVTIKYQDQDGKEQKLSASGLLAIAIQHELDHLNGRLLVDYISRIEHDMYLKELKKICAQKK